MREVLTLVKIHRPKSLSNKKWALRSLRLADSNQMPMLLGGVRKVPVSLTCRMTTMLRRWVEMRTTLWRCWGRDANSKPKKRPRLANFLTPILRTAPPILALLSDPSPFSLTVLILRAISHLKPMQAYPPLQDRPEQRTSQQLKTRRFVHLSNRTRRCLTLKAWVMNRLEQLVVMKRSYRRRRR